MDNISAAQNRPGRPKSEAKHSAILNSAGTLFLRDGYDKTSMDAVAREAGVSKQTVYSHFSGKEDLFRACIRDKVEEYGLDMDRLSSGLPLREALTMVGNQFMELLADEKVMAMHRLLAAECLTHKHLTQSFFEIGPRTTMMNLARYLRDHRGPGRLDMDDHEQAAQMFFALLKQMYFTQRLFDLRPPMSASERHQHVDDMVGVFLKIYG